MVFDEIVLQRSSGERDPAKRLHLVDGPRDCGDLVLQQMALVANDEVGAGVRQAFLEDGAKFPGNAGSS